MIDLNNCSWKIKGLFRKGIKNILTRKLENDDKNHITHMERIAVLCLLGYLDHTNGVYSATNARDTLNELVDIYETYYKSFFYSTGLWSAFMGDDKLEFYDCVLHCC